MSGAPGRRTVRSPPSSPISPRIFSAIDRNEADAYVEHGTSCVWREGLDPGADRTHAALEARMGWKPGDLAAFARLPATIQRFEAETDAASARGAFGVPTFFIGDEMWWGNDRLDFVERYLNQRR